MKLRNRGLVLMSAALMLAAASRASDEYFPFVWSLEPVSTFDRPGEIEMEMRLDIDTAWCNERDHTGYYDFEGTTCNLDIVATGGLRVLGDTAIAFGLSGGPLETFRFRVLVPDDTVSSVAVKERSESPWGVRYFTKCRRYFVTTGDTCEYRGGSPRLSAAALQARMPKDTTRYRVKMDLRDPEQLRIVSSVADTSGYPIEPTDEPGYYIVWLTARSVKYLKSDGFRYEVIDIPPPLPEVPEELKMKERRVSPKPSLKPRPRPTGKLDTDCAVYVTCVDGEDEWGRIYANQLATVFLSFWNGTGESIYGIDNAFKVYADPGVSWPGGPQLTPRSGCCGISSTTALSLDRSTRLSRRSR